jgi:2-methylisocitrate lyase-like PEP mutase family enzyme
VRHASQVLSFAANQAGFAASSLFDCAAACCCLAGADILYPHNILDRQHLLKLTRAVREAPLLHDVVEPQSTYSDQELEDMGFKVVIHGRANILCQAKAITSLWSHYRTHGETKGYLDHLMNQEDWSDLIDNAAENNIRDLLKD